MTIDEFKKNIAPFMRPGYVAMDKDGMWWWYTYKPICYLSGEVWRANKNSDYTYLSYAFNIEPVEDWTKSLIEVGK